jgi:hypothetical protein
MKAVPKLEGPSSVPFPGNLYSASAVRQYIKKRHPELKLQWVVVSKYRTTPLSQIHACLNLSIHLDIYELL